MPVHELVECLLAGSVIEVERYLDSLDEQKREAMRAEVDKQFQERMEERGIAPIQDEQVDGTPTDDVSPILSTSKSETQLTSDAKTLQDAPSSLPISRKVDFDEEEEMRQLMEKVRKDKQRRRQEEQSQMQRTAISSAAMVNCLLNGDEMAVTTYLDTLLPKQREEMKDEIRTQFERITDQVREMGNVV